MTLKKQTEDAIKFLELYGNQNSRISANIRALKNAKIIMKKWWKPRDVITRMNYATTFSDHEVHMGLPYPKCSIREKAWWLLHESVHLLQYLDMDRRVYWLAYINPFSDNFRDRMEQEANEFTYEILGF